MSLPKALLGSSMSMGNIYAATMAAFLLSSPLAAQGPSEIYSQGGTNDPGTTERTDRTATPVFMEYPSTVPFDSELLGWPAATSTPSGIIPIGVDSERYFNFENQRKVLVGVSADVACHLHVGNGSDICIFDRTKPSFYKKVVNDAAAKGLNKMRLVVGFPGPEPYIETLAEQGQGVHICNKPVQKYDYPFKYYPGSGGSIGYWRLDQRNDKFFQNLKAVVEHAAKNKFFVEVTFFAPWFHVWELGPFHVNHGRTAAGSAGFTSRTQLATIPAGGDPPGSAAAAAREAQRNLVRWTIDALWDQPRVYWEIANEPEIAVPGSTEDCPDQSAMPAVTAESVRTWQEDMINTADAYERSKYVLRPGEVNPNKLTRPHLIAVQPFSITGVGHYLQNSKVTVVNGHYTTVSQGSQNLGAMALVRGYGGYSPDPTPATGRIIGFNEGKISGIGGKGGTANNGGPDSARAEAWEFVLSRGASYDHFGYNYSSANGQAVRRQLGLLQSFVGTLPLPQLISSPNAGSDKGPAWISLKPYDTSRQENLYWTALEPKVGAQGVSTYVAYIHHSRPRRSNDESSEISELAFQGYYPLVSSQYSETYKLCFGPAAGTYVAEWFCPEKNERTGNAVTINWPGSTTCANGGTGAVSITTPTYPISPPSPIPPGCRYTYDIVLKVRKTG